MTEQTQNVSLLADWREQAIIKALPTNSEYGDGVGVLLQEIRTHRPGCAVIIANLDRLAMLHFFSRETDSYKALLDGSIQRYGRNVIQTDESYPYIGWYGVQWRGLEAEVILPPGATVGSVVCVADSGSALHTFVEAMTAFALRPHKRCLQYSGGWKSAPDLDSEIGRVTWDDIVLKPAVLNGLRDAVEGFFTNRRMFAALGFAWRRGILLVGPPGTGKTMVCKAAAAALPDLPFLYVRDIRNMRGQEPIKAIFDRARRLAPCMLAFEDVDGFIDDANRSLFLNELDGFQNNEGLLIIASSNHPGRIDEALLKRPSRFDRVFHLGLPDREERLTYCRRLLGSSTLTEQLAQGVEWDTLSEQVADHSDGFTPAYLKEAFVSAALQQAIHGATLLDVHFAEAVLMQVEELRQYLQRARVPDSLSDMAGSSATIGLRR